MFKKYNSKGTLVTQEYNNHALGVPSLSGTGVTVEETLTKNHVDSPSTTLVHPSPRVGRFQTATKTEISTAIDFGYSLPSPLHGDSYFVGEGS